MFTTCPKCSLTLVVTTGDLRAAQGFVRCGRCSNVFNALANLSEDRSANADTAATGQQRILQQPSPPREAVESGTPEESPRYEDSSATLTSASMRTATQPQFETPVPMQRVAQQPQFETPVPMQRAAPQPQFETPTPMQRAAQQPTPQPLPPQQPAFQLAAPRPAPPPPGPAPQPAMRAAPGPGASPQRTLPSQPQPAPVPQGRQQGFAQPTQQFSPTPQQGAPSPQFLPQPSQSPPARGSSLPPPTAEDLDDIPDISMEFDADTADISQVFVQTPARRLVLDGNTGTFETIALKEPPPAEADRVDTEFDSQLRALAAQLAAPLPAPAPPPQQVLQQAVQQAPPPQARSSAPAQRAAPSTSPTPLPAPRDTGATGTNPVLRMRPPAAEPAVARQTQPAPAQVAPQAKQSPPPQNREPPPPPAPRPSARAELDDIPVEDVEVVVRQSTGAPTPTAGTAPTARQPTNAPAADSQPPARPAKSKPPRGPAPPKKKANAQARRAAAPERKGRSPEELIQAAAEVVKRAGRKPPAAADVDEPVYVDGPEIDVVPDISSESFPTRMRRRAFEAIETDGAALRARIPSLSWGTAAVALSALFVLQVINHYRNELATSDRLRKPLTSLYRAFGVTLVPRWDIGAYEVRQLGAQAGAGNLLTVRLSVKNGAKSAQPLPYLRVTVQDRYGNRIASRDVPPKVYSPKRARTLLNADSRIDAEVAFADPGQNAVGFEIDACLPTDSGRIACANDQIAR